MGRKHTVQARRPRRRRFGGRHVTFSLFFGLVCTACTVVLGAREIHLMWLHDPAPQVFYQDGERPWRRGRTALAEEAWLDRVKTEEELWKEVISTRFFQPKRAERPIPRWLDDLHAPAYAIASGWPCRAMRYTRDDLIISLSDPSTHPRHAIPWPSRIPGGNVWPANPDAGTAWIPIQPLWPGLLANVLFFSLAGWLLIACLIGLRRAVRRRHGLCPSCSYNRDGLSGDTPCPECGGPR